MTFSPGRVQSKDAAEETAQSLWSWCRGPGLVPAAGSCKQPQSGPKAPLDKDSGGKEEPPALLREADPVAAFSSVGSGASEVEQLFVGAKEQR